MIVTIDGIPVYNALITDAETGMFKISLVDEPAVMSDFMAFDRQRRPQMYAVQDEEKRLVRGVVMRADFPIYRNDPAMGEYYIIYKADTIRNMAEKYLAESRQNLIVLMHAGKDVEGVQMVQFFIKDSAAGVAPAGFEDIADGSLFAEFHIVSDEIWAAIKDGTYKGFSLEGVFDMAPEREVTAVEEIVEETEGKFNSNTQKSMNTKLAKLRAGLARLLAQFGAVTTDRGVLVWDGDDDLAEGVAVFVEDEEGNRSAAEDGEYVTADNKTIVVVDGKVAEIRDPEAEVAPEAEPEAQPEELESEETNRGTLAWDGELAVGVAVTIDGEPAPDGEYTLEDGRVVVVEGGVVVEIREPEAEGREPSEDEGEGGDDDAPDAEEALRKENTTLRAQLKAAREELAAIKRQPAAKPAHEEVKASAALPKTGNKGLDNLARYFSK